MINQPLSPTAYQALTNMTDVSSELNLPPPKIDQIRSDKNADKSVGRLKRGVRKVILGTPIAGLLISSGNVENPNIHAPNIKESTLASAPLPKNTTHNTDILQPYTPEQKENKELESPTDLITEKELEERFGIKIFQLRGNVELGFRRGVEKDPLFQGFEKTRDNKETYIVLVNGPYLDPQFLTAEQKAALQDEEDKDVIRALATERSSDKDEAREWFKAKKDEKIAEYYRLRHELESKHSLVSQERYEVEHQALEYQYAPFLKGPTDEDINNASQRSIGAGIERFVKRNGKEIIRYYVFLAVKDTERTKKFQVGNEELEVLKPRLENIELSYQLTPDPTQSYPSPDSITIDRAQPTYPIRKGWTPGIIARHELKHTTRVPHPQADLDLVSDIETAYQNYKNNGDDSGYWIVFKTPKGPVITERRTPEAKNTTLT